MNFTEIFRYDETSPTFIRWINSFRLGRGGKPVRRINDCQAGNITSDGRLAITYKGKVYSINQVVWEIFNGKVPTGRQVMSKDDDLLNCEISNLELNIVLDNKEYKYGKYLADFFVYEEDSPSALKWKRVNTRGSTVKVGDVVGSNDNGYWKVHALGRSLSAHKIVWALHNNFENQDGLHIDHIDGNPSNNKIENLRLVAPTLNARNKPMLKNNTSGIHGVCFQTVKTKSGNYVDRYVAGWRTLDGRAKTKCFSVGVYGSELAEHLASESRLHQMDLLRLMDAGYTERHGT